MLRLPLAQRAPMHAWATKSARAPGVQAVSAAAAPGGGFCVCALAAEAAEVPEPQLILVHFFLAPQRPVQGHLLCTTLLLLLRCVQPQLRAVPFRA